MAKRKLILDASLAEALLKFCESKFILPDDLLRIALQQPPEVPFLVDASEISGHNQTHRMLRILEHLYKRDPGKFDKAAAAIGGHRRLWFSRNPNEISESGSSNTPQRIGSTPWFVSTNCPFEGMRSRVEKVMIGMGFPRRYTSLVAWSISIQKGRIDAADYFEMEKKG
ncbi:MAG TPA: hypothetical protein PKM73_05755 [Verrucomicrobiota bacterium]|nr:hypothetical protein [Verrucomicrobiota bacterium]